MKLVKKYGKKSSVIYLYDCEVGANRRYCQTIANQTGWTVYAAGVKVLYGYVYAEAAKEVVCRVFPPPKTWVIYKPRHHGEPKR